MTPHAPSESSSGTSLTIGRAFVHGGMRRERLMATLARAPLDGLGLGRDEYLIVPHLAMPEPLRYGDSGTAYAGTVSKRLRSHLEKAVLDPVRGALDGRPLRFSTKAKMALWLITEYGHEKSALPAAIQLVTGTPTISLWQQRELLGDAPLLIQTGAALFARKALGRWIGTLSDRQVESVKRSITASYGCEVPVAEAPARPGLRSDPPLQGGSARLSSSPQPQFIGGPPGEASLLSPSLRTAIANDPALVGLNDGKQALAATILYLAFFPAASRTQALCDFIAKFLVAVRTDHDEVTVTSPDLWQERDLLLEKQASDKMAANSALAGFGNAARQGSKENGFQIDVDQNSRSNPALQARARDNTGLGKEKLARLQPSDTNSDDLIDLENTAKNETRFDSNYCGLMFLINPLIQLGFCRDFGLVTDDALDLSPFATIDALGRHWFGNKFQSDPVHGLLSKSHQPAGYNKAFALPRPQIFDFAGVELKLVRDRRRLTIWHRDGAPLRDMPAATPRRKVRAAAKLLGSGKLPGRGVRAQKGLRLPQSSARRWTAALARLLEWRLATAIMGYPVQIRQLCLPGSFAIREGKINVEIALDNLPFAVRIAGLDRDPGWLMKEGRSLAFVFA